MTFCWKQIIWIMKFWIFSHITWPWIYFLVISIHFSENLLQYLDNDREYQVNTAYWKIIAIFMKSRNCSSVFLLYWYILFNIYQRKMLWIFKENILHYIMNIEKIFTGTTSLLLRKFSFKYSSWHSMKLQNIQNISRL